MAAAFSEDRDLLEAAGYEVDVALSQPGFIRATVRKEGRETRIDRAHDSAWCFLPPVRDPVGGFVLHEIDLAVDKTLALAGRDEARDLVDILYAHDEILPLGALVWAAVGEDPGFTPLSLLEQLKRTGRYRPEEIERLDLAVPFELVEGKERWLAALAEAETFVESRPADEVGCLHYSEERERFEAPAPDRDLASQGLVPHYGRPGGVLPRPADQALGRE